MLEILNSLQKISIKQKKELGELVGFETRNKYSIETPEGKQIGFAAEQQKGFFGFLFRQFLGHWRTFNILVFDEFKKPILTAKHPFRFFFQRLDLYKNDNSLVGSIQQRFGIIYKKFDIEAPNGNVIMTMQSPLWRIWTFPIYKNDNIVSTIRKKWSGLLKETFLDADNFTVEFSHPNLTLEEKTIITIGAIFIDLKYFEKKASSN